MNASGGIVVAQRQGKLDLRKGKGNNPAQISTVRPKRAVGPPMETFIGSKKIWQEKLIG